jgi:hypothetical protein
MAPLKVTPGPWRRGSDELSSPELFCEIYAANGFRIAVCSAGNLRGKDGREGVEYARGNATLMAAAPELLDELRVARAALADFEGLTAPHAHALARRFEALITKAEGRAAGAVEGGARHA